MSVVESATRLFDLLAAKDDTFTRYLRPGLAEDRIREIMAPTGVELPREAVDFYGRFSLPRGYQYSEDQPTLYGIYWLLSLEDAVEQYGAQKRDGLYQSPEKVAAGGTGWFPLLQEDANFYMLNTAHADGGSCAILTVSEYADVRTAFVSMEAMFDTLYHWVREGALPVEAGHVAGDYEGDPVRVAEIAARFNPGVGLWVVR
ncbi:MAG TPA: hypothetical protein VGC13_30540 [Longimicrobium sp.]|uniref:hypothetical protein n=1 Tax=Longimicrobium sp. TaxID=2029185 RepID=UPI002ED7D7A5